MNKTLAVLSLLLVFPILAKADSQWALQKSTLIYHITHPLHEAEGVSHAARGRGECHSGECNFLVAAPVKSFASGDSNRDLHMLQVTRGAEFPMIIVRTEIPESDLTSRAIHAALEIQFAGQTVDYKQVPFQLTQEGKDIRLTGTIPAKVSDFKINPPKLLTIPIKNDIPISVDMTWSPQ